jgi:acetoin utilization deacetylase AcuC-like enzyme
MTTLLLTHTACLDHATPAGHPERPDRLRAVAQVLSEDRFKGLSRSEAPSGNLDLVTLCHDEHYVGELRRVAPSSGLIYLDGDTSMSPGTWEAVMRGVGGHSQQRLRRGSPSRPSRRALDANGLLLF